VAFLLRGFDTRCLLSVCGDAGCWWEYAVGNYVMEGLYCGAVRERCGSWGAWCGGERSGEGGGGVHWAGLAANGGRQVEKMRDTMSYCTTENS
jgi:hypothetical protein